MTPEQLKVVYRHIVKYGFCRDGTILPAVVTKQRLKTALLKIDSIVDPLYANSMWSSAIYYVTTQEGFNLKQYYPAVVQSKKINFYTTNQTAIGNKWLEDFPSASLPICRKLVAGYLDCRFHYYFDNL